MFTTKILNDSFRLTLPATEQIRYLIPISFIYYDNIDSKFSHYLPLGCITILNDKMLAVHCNKHVTQPETPLKDRSNTELSDVHGKYTYPGNYITAHHQ